MKNCKSILKAVLLPALFVGAISLTGCKKESVEPTEYSELQMLPGKYKRIVTLQDGGSTVTLGLSSNNQDVLDEFEAGAAMVATAENLTEMSQSSSESAMMTDSSSATERVQAHVVILRKELAPNMQSFRLKVDYTEDAGSGKTSLHAYHTVDWTFHSTNPNHQFHAEGRNGKRLSAYYYYKYKNGTVWNHYTSHIGFHSSALFYYKANWDMALSVRGCNSYDVWWQ